SRQPGAPGSIFYLGLGFLFSTYSAFSVSSAGCPRFDFLPGSWVSLLCKLRALRFLRGEHSFTLLPRPAVSAICVSLFSSSFNSQLSTLNLLPLFRHTIPTTHAHSSRCHHPRPLRRNRSNGCCLPLQLPHLV